MRLEQLDENQLIQKLSDYRKQLDELKNQQTTGSASLQTYFISTSSDQYDVAITHSALRQENLLEYRFTANTQENPIVRLFITVTDNSGKFLAFNPFMEPTSPPVHMFKKHSRLIGRESFHIVWLEQAQPGSATYKYKAYALASDDGKLELINNA